MMVSRESHSSGFTLIELLVVVAIIALLISILLPTLSPMRQQVGVACRTAFGRDAFRAMNECGMAPLRARAMEPESFITKALIALHPLGLSPDGPRWLVLGQPRAARASVRTRGAAGRCPGVRTDEHSAGSHRWLWLPIVAAVPLGGRRRRGPEGPWDEERYAQTAERALEDLRQCTTGQEATELHRCIEESIARFRRAIEESPDEMKQIKNEIDLQLVDLWAIALQQAQSKAPA